MALESVAAILPDLDRALQPILTNPARSSASQSVPRLRQAHLRLFRRGSRVLLFPFPPILAEQLDRMRRANGAVAAAHVFGGAKFIAPPANSLGMFGMDRDLGHNPVAETQFPAFGPASIILRIRVDDYFPDPSPRAARRPPKQTPALRAVAGSRRRRHRPFPKNAS